MTSTCPPAGTVVSTNGLTDMAGIAVATVQAGTTVGAFTVKARVIVGMRTIEVYSPTIGLRGAKPTNKSFSLVCTPFNISAYISAAPPKLINVDCKARVADRFNNAVGTGTTVNFKSEVGTIPASIASKIYDPATSNPEEGTALVTFSTQGAFPAVPTEPLAADPNQFPTPRPAEPSVADGQITRNPRDGLVTIIAYTHGEEFYDDANSNGKWDSNERFYDEGEPFVDSNDNGVWDSNEFYVDDNGDGVYNGPNNKWDSDKSVWAMAHILYTGSPDPTNSHWTPSTLNVPKAALVNASFYFLDLNMNRITNEFTFSGANIAISKAGFSVTLNDMGPLPDGFGMNIESDWLDATTGKECLSTSTRCLYSTRFRSWPMGFGGTITAKGADATDMTPPITFGYRLDAKGPLPGSITLPITAQ